MLDLHTHPSYNHMGAKYEGALHGPTPYIPILIMLDRYWPWESLPPYTLYGARKWVWLTKVGVVRGFTVFLKC